MFLDFPAICCICLEELHGARRRLALECGHVLHNDCVAEMRRRSVWGRCPLCRTASHELRTAHSLVEEAVIHYIRHCYAEAGRLVQEALLIKEDDPRAQALLGDLLRRGLGVPKDLNRARELYQAARFQGFSEASLALGSLNKELGHLSEAEAFFFEGFEAGNMKAIIHLALLYKCSGQRTLAMSWFEYGRNLGLAEASTGLGVLFKEAGDFGMAKELFHEGRARGDPSATMRLGKLLQRQGNLREAELMFKEAREGGDMHAASCLGSLYQARGQLSDARTLFQESCAAGDLQGSLKLSQLEGQEDWEVSNALHSSGGLS